MRVITINNLTLQFDADQITHGNALQQAQAALDMINLELQRQPYGLGAQIMTTSVDNADVMESDSDVDKSTWVVRIRATMERDVRVMADNEKEAIESAHEEFNVAYVGDTDFEANEKYREEMLSCTKLPE